MIVQFVGVLLGGVGCLCVLYLVGCRIDLNRVVLKQSDVTCERALLQCLASRIWHVAPLIDGTRCP